MNYWLVKSEPSKYPWDQFVKEGKTYWDGVRNFAARNHLKSMKLGDLVLYYHSNEGLAVVGYAKVVKEHYQDPTTEDTNWVVVDLEPVKKLDKEVSLKQIKADKRLENMVLLKIGRLSVSPVTKEEFDAILEIGTK